MIDEPVYKPINWKSLMCYIYIIAAVSLGYLHFMCGVEFYHNIKKPKI